MRKSFFAGFILSLLIVLASCNPFTMNLYSSFDKFKMPDLNNLNDVLDASDEPQFFENLEEDPSAKAEVLSTLQDVIDDPTASPEDVGEAALLAADVHLKTSGTEETMESLNTLIGDLVGGEMPEPPATAGPEYTLRMIFGEPPAGVAKSTYKASVKIQLTAFLGAAEALQSYGEARENGAPVPPDVNTGDTAMKALLSGMTRTLIFYINLPDPLDELSEYLATPKDANGDIVPNNLENNYDGAMPDFDAAVDGPISEMLKDPADSANPDKDGLIKVVDDGIGIEEIEAMISG